MTLSHRWGKSGLDREFKMLTSSTLESLATGIAIQSLSRTFQEAILIARSLGSQYLWIDALCIIQGDSEDWERESSSMATVYGFSQLNIAASAASKGSEGCFQTRDPALIRTVKVSVAMDVSKSRLLTALCSPNWRQLKSQIQSSPLAQRAWVFQETYLAERTLYFTATQIWWGCAQHVCCEIFPRGLLRKGWRPTVPNSKDEIYGSVSHWSEIVDLFSKGCLTFESDKLVSLSGVARHFAQLYNLKESDYLAGLWRPHVIGDICWVSEGSYRSSRQHSIPTWSWASVIPVEQFRDKLNSDNLGSVSQCYLGQQGRKVDFTAEILEAEVERIHGAYGPVQGGFMRLKCGPLIHWPLGDMTTEEPSPNSFMPLCSLGFCHLEENPSDAEGGLFLLRFKMDLTPLEDSSEFRPSQYCCLIVETVPGAMGVYRRIGLVKMHDGYFDYLEGNEANIGYGYFGYFGENRNTMKFKPEDRLCYYEMRGPSKFGNLPDNPWWMLAPCRPNFCTDENFYEEPKRLNENGTPEYGLRLI